MTRAPDTANPAATPAGAGADIDRAARVEQRVERAALVQHADRRRDHQPREVGEHGRAHRRLVGVRVGGGRHRVLHAPHSRPS
jgi:hypothetical protein